MCKLSLIVFSSSLGVCGNFNMTAKIKRVKEFEISQSTEQKDKKYLMNFQVHKSAESELRTLAAAASPLPSGVA